MNLVVLFILGIVLVGNFVWIALRYTGEIRTRSLQKFAESRQGLTFVPLKRKKQAHVRGTLEGFVFRIVDEHQPVCGELQFPERLLSAEGGTFHIVQCSLSDGIQEALGAHRIATGDLEFDEKYAVWAFESHAALALLSPDVRRALLRFHDKVDVVEVSARKISWSAELETNTLQKDLEALVDLALRAGHALRNTSRREGVDIVSTREAEQSVAATIV